MQFSPLYEIKIPNTQKDTGTFGQAIPPIEITPGTSDGVIDVIGTMQFVGNDIGEGLKDRIPFCILKEYELVSNSTVSQLLYYVRSLGITDEQLAQTGGDVNKIVEKARAKGAELKGDKNNIIKTVVGNLFEGISSQLGNVSRALINDEKLDGVLLPYNGLYARKSTGFQYIFPYFEDLKKSISTNFTDSETGLLKTNAFSNITEGFKDVYQKIAGNLLTATPGAYIEQPKFFSPGSGENYRITFNLINTVDGSKIQRHLDFLFLLAFQNLPFRKNIAEVLPPKIYSFTLPGELYIPFAYISKLDVQFIGNRRAMSMRLPYIDRADRCIVPEVYSVTMDITSLTYTSANFMVADQLNKIIVPEISNQQPTPPTGGVPSTSDTTSQTPGTTTGGFRPFTGIPLGF
jgi:hypothetical protein